MMVIHLFYLAESMSLGIEFYESILPQDSPQKELT